MTQYPYIYPIYSILTVLTNAQLLKINLIRRNVFPLKIAKSANFTPPYASDPVSLLCLWHCTFNIYLFNNISSQKTENIFPIRAKILYCTVYIPKKPCRLLPFVFSNCFKRIGGFSTYRTAEATRGPACSISTVYRALWVFTSYICM